MRTAHVVIVAAQRAMYYDVYWATRLAPWAAWLAPWAVGRAVQVEPVVAVLPNVSCQRH